MSNDVEATDQDAPEQKKKKKLKAGEATKQYLADIHAAERKKLKTSTAPLAVAALQRQQGDRGDADDPADKLLPTFVKFKDLRRAGIAASWPTLLRLIKQQGFPQGVWLGANSRAWEVSSILAWIKDRPTALKVVAPRRRQHQENIVSPE
jgi:predicted DNA-binding transcriptional regulator AlpA